MRQYTKPHQNEGFTFSHSVRDIQKQADLSKDPPGAGTYDPQPVKGSGFAKSFLGGPDKKHDKDSGFPAPGAHDPKYPDSAPSWSMGRKPAQKHNKDEALANLGPGTHDPIYVSHVSKSAPFSMTAKGGRGPAVEKETDLSKKIRNA